MDLLARLQRAYPSFSYTPGERFYWSHQNQTIYFVPSQLDKHAGHMSLLHEIGHASLGHSAYRYDIELVRLEVAAWQYACVLGKKFNVRIRRQSYNKHLETYRNWLYARSSCPTCRASGIQNSQQVYACTHCRTTWKVPPTQLCRIQKRIQALPTIV